MYTLLPEKQHNRLQQIEREYEAGRLHRYPPHVIEKIRKTYLDKCDKHIRSLTAPTLVADITMLQKVSDEATAVVKQLQGHLPEGFTPFPQNGGALRVSFWASKDGKEIRWRVRPNSKTGLKTQGTQLNTDLCIKTGKGKVASKKTWGEALRAAATQLWELSIGQFAAHNCAAVNQLLTEATTRAGVSYTLSVVPEIFATPKNVGLFEDISMSGVVIAVSNKKILSLPEEYDTQDVDSLREGVGILEDAIREIKRQEGKAPEVQVRQLTIKKNMLKAHLKTLTGDVASAESAAEAREELVSAYVDILKKTPSPISLINTRGETRKKLVALTDLPEDHVRQARTLLADSTVKTIRAVYQSTKPPIRSVLVEGTTSAGEPWMGSVEYVETNGVYGFKERFPAVHKNLWVRLPQVDVVVEAQRIWEASENRSEEARKRFGYGTQGK